MKPLALLTAVLLSVPVAACDSSRNGITPGAPTTSATTVHSSLGTNHPRKKDRDNDEDNNHDDGHVLYFGRAPSATERRSITTLVNRYFVSAAAGNGAAACSLLTPFIAESVMEEYGHTPDLKGRTCASVMSKLFKLHHDNLARKSASLKVMRIGIEGDRSLVALEFTAIPVVREITVRYNGGRWTVLDLLDGNIE